MFTASQEMIEKINNLSNSQIIDIWEYTDKQIGSRENVLIRDAVMQVIENKYPALFENWMNNDYLKNPEGDNLRYWFIISNN